MAELLIKKGASVNTRNYLGETPLHSAALHGFTPVIELLLANGADINAVDERRQTPMDLAAASDDPSLEKLFKKFKAKNGTSYSTSLSVSGEDGQNADYFQGFGGMK